MQLQLHAETWAPVGLQTDVHVAVETILNFYQTPAGVRTAVGPIDTPNTTQTRCLNQTYSDRTTPKGDFW